MTTSFSTPDKTRRKRSSIGLRSLRVDHFSVLALSVTLASILLVKYGPSPTAQPHELLTDGVLGLREPTDRLVLLLWWGFALAVVLLASRTAGRANSLLDGAYPQVNHAGTAAVGLTVLASLLLPFGHSFTNNTDDPTIRAVLIGVLVAAPLWTLANSPRRWATRAGVAASFFAAVVSVPILWEAPNTVRDLHHFAFTTDEIAAVAAGKYPLSDYIPQYSNLLSFPIAPFLRIFRTSAVFVVLAWVLVLQLFVIVVPIAVAAKDRGWSIAPFGIGLVFVPAVALSNHGSNLSATAYFACMPLRYVGPMVILLVLRWWTLGHTSTDADELRLDRFFEPRSAALGATCGLAALNNPDFGMPAAAAAVVVVILLTSGRRRRLGRLAMISAGFFVPFGAYALFGELIGKPVHWQYWLLFQRVFGSAGFYAVPMSSFGEQLGYVVTFGAGAFLGVRAIRRLRPLPESRRQIGTAAALTFVSVWALGSLAYFSGRSFSSTLWGGHIVQLGMTVLLAMTVVLDELRDSDGQRRNLLEILSPATAACLVSGIVLVSLVTRFPSVPRSFTDLSRSSQRNPTLEVISKNVTTQPTSRRLAGQVMPMSNLVALQTGVESLSLFNDPSNLLVSDKFLELQCRELRRSTKQYLLYPIGGRRMEPFIACRGGLPSIRYLDPYATD